MTPLTFSFLSTSSHVVPDALLHPFMHLRSFPHVIPPSCWFFLPGSFLSVSTSSPAFIPHPSSCLPLFLHPLVISSSPIFLTRTHTQPPSQNFGQQVEKDIESVDEWCHPYKSERDTASIQRKGSTSSSGSGSIRSS
jgi:hypothetical protein